MLDFQIGDDQNYATIKVIGCGGAGNNAVNRMLEAGLTGVDFYAVNTDRQALRASKANHTLQIGEKVTKGLGAGAHPEIGEQAAKESTDEISKMVEGADLVFITAGMGGGTGTGAAPVIAGIAREKGILTIAVVTRPFNFEGPRRRNNAEQGIIALKQQVDTMVVIPNERLLASVKPGTSLQQAFCIADDVLRQAVTGISDLISKPAMINLDFADVKTVMESGGIAHMGIGEGSGDDYLMQAAKAAISSPLLETNIDGARSVLINITGNENMGMMEINEAITAITEHTDENGANIIFGAGFDPTMGDKEARITVIATGFDQPDMPNMQERRYVPEVSANDMPAANQQRPQNAAPMVRQQYNTPSFDDYAYDTQYGNDGMAGSYSAYPNMNMQQPAAGYNTPYGQPYRAQPGYENTGYNMRMNNQYSQQPVQTMYPNREFTQQMPAAPQQPALQLPEEPAEETAPVKESAPSPAARDSFGVPNFLRNRNKG